VTLFPSGNFSIGNNSEHGAAGGRGGGAVPGGRPQGAVTIGGGDADHAAYVHYGVT